MDGGGHDAADLPRIATADLVRMLAAHPAALVVGPRGSGKTSLARTQSAVMVRLDVPSEAALFAADPDVAIAAYPESPLLLDEWQEVPGVIGAVKRAVDAGAQPGRFLLTGSVGAQATEVSWPATGRVVTVHLGPMAQRELVGQGQGTGLLATLIAGDVPSRTWPEAPTLTGYIDLALRGGFPHPALRLDAEACGTWYRSYVDEVARRDVRALLAKADPARVRRYLEAYALNSAGTPDDSTLFTAAGITRPTAMGYERALEGLFVIRALPQWGRNRLASLTKAPKRLFADAGLMAAAARLAPAQILRSGDHLGRTLETFVAAQLAAEAAGAFRDMTLAHVRTAGGRHEVDLVLDLGDGRVVAVEVKATSSPAPADARHLAWLRDAIGDDFVHGVVLHTGAASFPLGDRITALPICALWAP